MAKDYFYKDQTPYIEGERAKLEKLKDANIPEVGIITKVLSHGSLTKEQNGDKYSITREVSYIDVDGLGIVGDRHYRAFRKAGGRERDIWPKDGGPYFIREHRHVFAVSEYDCWLLGCKIQREVTPELLGANLVIGREDLSPKFSISQLPVGTCMIIGEENCTQPPKPPISVLKMYTKQLGCVITGNSIANEYHDKSLSALFIEYAQDNRGLVCSVEYPYNVRASLKAGQKVFFRFPTGITP